MNAVVNDPNRTPSRCTARSRPNVNHEIPPKNSGLWNWIETRMPTNGNTVSQTIAHQAHALTKGLLTRSVSSIQAPALYESPCVRTHHSPDSVNAQSVVGQLYCPSMPSPLSWFG